MINGIINVYKESGYTSFDVVAKLRGISGQKKIGHTGTLDPMASGVLPICLGRATKVCELLTDWNKTYVATLMLGIETDTQDTTGSIVREEKLSHVLALTAERIRSTIAGFTGECEQIPPMYSARWIDGRRLYDLARKGITVERKASKIQIESIRILRVDLPYVQMEVTCSKGTYIRTLCSDIGTALGVGGCMASLTRTRVGCFRLRDAILLEELQEAKDEGKLEFYVNPTDMIFSDLPAVRIASKFNKTLYHGGILENGSEVEQTECGKDSREAGMPENVRIYAENGEFIGVYKNTGREYRPVKILTENIGNVPEIQNRQD